MRDAFRHIRGHALALACAVLLFCAAAPALAQVVTLENFVLDNQAGDMMVRFSLALEGAGEIGEALREGASMTLECETTLSRRRGWWFDATTARAEYQNTLTWDALKQEYVLQIQGQEHPLRNKSLPDLFRDSWAAIAMDLGSFSQLTRGREYVVDLAVSLKFADVPQWLRAALFFWNWDVAPATHYRMEFEY